MGRRGAGLVGAVALVFVTGPGQAQVVDPWQSDVATEGQEKNDSTEPRVDAMPEVVSRQYPDTDADGFHDDIDLCPNTQEVKNGFEDDDGCPDTAEPPDAVWPEPRKSRPLPPPSYYAGFCRNGDVMAGGVTLMVLGGIGVVTGAFLIWPPFPRAAMKTNTNEPWLSSLQRLGIGMAIQGLGLLGAGTTLLFVGKQKRPCAGNACTDFGPKLVVAPTSAALRWSF